MNNYTVSNKHLLRGASLGAYLLIIVWLSDTIADRYVSAAIVAGGIAAAATLSLLISKRGRMWIVDLFTLLFSWQLFGVVSALLLWLEVDFLLVVAAIQLIATVLIFFATYGLLMVWKIKYWMRVAIASAALIMWSLLCLYLVRLLMVVVIR